MNPMLRAMLQGARIALAGSIRLRIYSVVATIQAVSFYTDGSKVRVLRGPDKRGEA